jgi:tyrosyl-tRNA synthetase
MPNVYDELSERGFIQQVSNEAVLSKKLAEEKVTCYIGFDPTADSLHAGSMVPIMALAHMQRFGHKRHHDGRRPERQNRNAQDAHA